MFSDEVEAWYPTVIVPVSARVTVERAVLGARE